MPTPRAFLITGATKGIGRALSERLVRYGHQVVGFARGPDPDFPGELVSVDLADPAATATALDDAVRRQRLAGVVNNVGLVRPQPLGEVRLDDLAAVLDLNLRVAVQTVQAALPAMRGAGWGRVVNISSLTVLGVLHRTAYAAAKAGLISFTRSWALELATTGITVNADRVVPREQPARQRRRGPLPRQRANASLRPAGRDRRGHCLSAVRRRRVHHRPDFICRRWRLGRPGGTMTGAADAEQHPCGSRTAVFHNAAFPIRAAGSCHRARSVGLRRDTGGLVRKFLRFSAGKKYYSLILQASDLAPIADRGLPYSD